MSFKLFTDRVELASSVLKDDITSADTPTLRYRTSIEATSAPSYPYNINLLRQGADIIKDSQRTSLLPTLGSKFKLDDNNVFIRDLEEINLGQAKEYSDGPVFDDCIDIIIKPEDYLTAPPTAYYPVVLTNPAYDKDNLHLMNGVIEPIPIRKGMPNTIETPYQIQGAKAALQNGNESEYAGSDVTSQAISKIGGRSSYFVDSQNVAMSSENFKLADMGFSTKKGAEPQLFDDALIMTNSLDLSLTSSFRYTGLVNQFEKSATAGFHYLNNPDGTDSVDFGGLKRVPENRARIKNKPYKIIIEDLSNKTGSIPTLKGLNPQLLGNYNPGYFNDTKTLIFLSGTNIQYPDMVNPAYQFAINSRANANPLTVTNGIMQPNLPIQQRSAMMKSFGPQFVPFDESRIYLERTGFYLTGSYHGTVPLRSMAQIKFNIGSAREKHVLRLPVSRTPQNSEFSTGGTDSRDSKSGFVYFNFQESEWQDIGLHDPVTGDAVPYDYSVEVDNTGLITSGTNLFPMQFSNSPCRSKFISTTTHEHPSIGGFNTYGTLHQLGYPTIGSPTNAAQAPFATKYHATASHTIKMSDFIAYPFLLEKVVVNLPIVARRKQGFYDNTAVGGHTPMLVEGASRDIDNYVFFIYRQQRSGKFGIDTVQDVSASNRYIVCSGSMSFINSQVTSASLNLHTPAFLYDFDTPVSGSDSSAIAAESLYTGSIRLNMRPSVPRSGYWGESSLPDGAGNSIKQRGSSSPLLQNAWSGGTTQTRFEGLSYTLLSDPVVGGTEAPVGCGRTNALVNFNPESTLYRDQSLATDHRPFRNALGGTARLRQRQAGYDPITQPKGLVPRQMMRSHTQFSRRDGPSSYLLFPEDELVFGIDAGIANNPARNTSNLSGSILSDGGDPTGTDSYSFMTGSFLKILSKDASVTFFGTFMINQGKALNNITPAEKRQGVSHGLNQNLTSLSIFTPINDELIYNQKDIAPPTSFGGSYVEHVVTGVMKEGNRAIGYSLSNNNLGASGSFFRNVKLVDSKERFYDTILPSIRDYAALAGAQVGKHNTVAFDPITFLDEKSSNRMPYPYAGNPFRNLSDTTKIVQLTNNVSQQGASVYFGTQKDVAEALFTEGGEVIGQNGAIRNHRMTGARAFRYGVKNVNKEFTAAIFRRDHFGHVRDLLEQRQLSKFQIGGETTEPAVSAIFRNSDGDRVEGGLTMAVNTDPAMTSSVPYSEGDLVVTSSYSNLQVVGINQIVVDPQKSGLPADTISKNSTRGQKS